METQNISETLVEGSVDYKPVQSQNQDGKTLEEFSALSSLSESYAGSELVTEVPLSECYGGESANVDKNIANGDDNVELVGVEFEQKLVDGYDEVDPEGVLREEELANVDDNNDLEGVEKLANVDDNNDAEGVEKLANVDGNNDLEGVEKLPNVDGNNALEGVEKLANVDGNNDLEGVEKLADVDGNNVLEGVEKLANVDGNNDLESVEKLADVDGDNDLEGVEKFASVDDNNDLEGVNTEQKLLVNGQGTVESENKLANLHDYNDLAGVEDENKFGDVDDTIDLEALGLENLMEGGTLKHETEEVGAIIPETNKINDDGDVRVAGLDAELNESQDNGFEKVGMVDAVETIDTSNVHSNDSQGKIGVSGNGISLTVDIFNESQDNEVKKVGMIDAVETIDASNVHANGSPRKIDVSGDGISLTVDVFGPLDGMYPVHNSSYKDGQMLGVSGSDYMLSVKNEAEGDVSDNQEHNFAVGDLVWVKIKTDLWWPGMICDPHASKDAGKCDKRNGFFVKHFGNSNSVWCQAFQLKPFIEYFGLMSCQNKSKSFYGAIEKALGEFGRRVKQKMTCSCFSKENQVAAQNFPSKEDGSGGSVFSASQFEPSNFLEFIRLRALDLRSPGSIEFTVTENCLLAFYSSIGHKQLPLYKLRPTNNVKDNATNEDLDKLSSDDCKMAEMGLSGSLESPRGMRSMISCSPIANGSAGGNSEKGFESRERKKSKYLSYPYVNSWGRKNSLGQGEDETEDPEEASLGGVKSSSSPSMVSTPIGNGSNKNSLRKSRKSVVDNGVCNNTDFTAASSAEMLQELHLTALDCFFPSQSTCSIPIQDFYLSFRTFRDPEVQMDEYKETTLGCEETFESDNILAYGVNDLQVEGPPPNVLPKKRSRKKSEDRNATGPNMNGSALIDSVETGPDALKKGTGRGKKKKAATAADVYNEIGVLGGLPDLNGNNAGLSVENMQVIGPAPTQGKLEPKRRRRKKDELVSGNLPDVSKSNTGSFPLEGSPQPVNMLGVQGATSLLNAELLSGQPNVNVSHAACSSLPNNSHITGLVSSAKAEGKKRKRKEKTSNIQNNSSALPDLNGQIADPTLKGKEFTGLSSITVQDKPKRKRRRTTKSAAIGIPNPNGDHNTLLLNFALGSSVPSKEYITACFSSYGPLEESKTQYLNDSTAQVVFVKDSDAIEALRNLQSRNPFGPALVSYRLRHVSTSNTTQASHSFPPAVALSGAVPSNGEGPDLVVIKQNLEAMTTMLEKAGDNISPEMRAKLESEVKGFLKKVSSMVGSSS
ncbi:uncharacterized protein LOC132052452 [Lycium ferocissimum]|uniref:uncharacterized protein LOC132052452 n=1 Tax=Lycium ferocissimum TaxID=112874 RepID=UPI002816974F|nr:uncharacterized protein LOC132052452 [Lycium ferocissimum]XP_059299977.1 uncharacterized protein LOC132052452 [Lycium ferocissimum]XP_059299978.1 uncharacterized protein LOC132052452 [Lycium ferocissimum]